MRSYFRNDHKVFKMKDFRNYKFRASQCYKLMAGTIGLTDVQQRDLSDLLARKMAAASGELDDKGKPVKPLTS